MIHESLLYRKKSEHPNWQSARINTEVDMWRTAWHIRERNSQHNVNIHQRLTMYAAWIPSVCTVQKYSKLKPKFQLPTPGKWPVKSVVGNCYVNASPRTLPRLCLHWRNEMWYRTALSVIGTSHLNNQLASNGSESWRRIKGTIDFFNQMMVRVARQRTEARGNPGIPQGW